MLGSKVVKQTVVASLLTAIIVGGSMSWVNYFSDSAIADMKLHNLEEAVQKNNETLKQVESLAIITQENLKHNTENLKTLTKVVEKMAESVNDLKVVSGRHNVLLEDLRE